MRTRKTYLHFLPENEKIPGNPRSGISLHCHTAYSKEMLDFVPHYVERLPVISDLWKKECDRYFERTGKTINFTTAFWSPPLVPQAVYEMEKAQINKLGLAAIVSLTDHDSTAANLEIRFDNKKEEVPISLEWTTPFEDGFFHIGVHNLPPIRANDLIEMMLAYTFSDKTALGENQAEERLSEILACLNEIPEILVVLNHPLWDIEMLGREKHLNLLHKFLIRYAVFIHALEFNGFRSWSENKEVLRLAVGFDLPVVSGGDRHGCQPNAVINLASATTFPEFVFQIRRERYSEIALFPSYFHPLRSRQLESFAEALKFYPEFAADRRRWFDRVHIDIGDGNGIQQLSTHWRRGGPRWLRWAIWGLGVLGHHRVRPFFHAFEKRTDTPKTIYSKTNVELEITST